MRNLFEQSFSKFWKFLVIYLSWVVWILSSWQKWLQVTSYLMLMKIKNLSTKTINSIPKCWEQRSVKRKSILNFIRVIKNCLSINIFSIYTDSYTNKTHIHTHTHTHTHIYIYIYIHALSKPFQKNLVTIFCSLRSERFLISNGTLSCKPWNISTFSVLLALLQYESLFLRSFHIYALVFSFQFVLIKV